MTFAIKLGLQWKRVVFKLFMVVSLDLVTGYQKILLE